jgi:methionyl-tRNA synthetase
MTMSEKILVTAALPYANGSIHIGHIVEYLQADIYTRFLKLTGKEVIYLCADDTHGTPIYLKAKMLNISPETLIEHYHREHQQDFRDFQIEFDYYHSTNSPENQRLSVWIFNQLQEKGYVFTKEVEQFYCLHDKIFLSDRLIKGTCPNCKSADQYGDICEVCGLHYNTTDLVDPYCSLCNNRPVIRSSSHYFFKLSDFKSRLQAWAIGSGRLQKETYNSIKEWLNTGLRDWDISRDAPYFGFKIPGEDSKYFYVWVDAPVGYIATTEKYCKEKGQDFDSYWHDENTKIFHFIGKDIIYFHTLFWPAMLMGTDFNLPSSVFVHGFLTVNGKKMSKSRGTFITARQYLNHLDPQYLRYYIASKLSGASDDIDLNFEDFQAKVNAELVNTIVNLGCRAVSMLTKNFSGLVTGMGKEMTDNYGDYVAKMENVKELYEKREFGKAIGLVVQMAAAANKLFSDTAPWKRLDEEPDIAHEVCTFLLNVFKLISIAIKPVLPQLSFEIEKILRLVPQLWRDVGTVIHPGHRIGEFSQLVSRVDYMSVDEMV